jgi:hypothetical protein
MGVSDKTLKLFDAIKPLLEDKKDSRQKWDLSIEFINKEANDFYILESLESGKNRHYRVLVPWLYSSNALIPRHKIEQLIEYYEDPHKADRITKYQNACINKSVNYMFEKVPINLESAIAQSNSVDIHIIRNKVYLGLVNVIHNSIKKIKPKTEIDMYTIIHDPKISSELRSILLDLKEMAGQVDNDFLAGELLTSYIADIHYTVRRLMKELHEGYTRKPLVDISPSSAQVFLEEMLMNIINRVFGEKDNIFAAIQMKQILLTHGQE